MSDILGCNVRAAIQLTLLISLLYDVIGFDLTILHTNDVHARFLQFNKYGTDCSDKDANLGKCFGGVARRHTKVKEIRSSHDNVIFIDAGDQFLGTVWFTYYAGNATSNFMNKLGYEVTVSNTFIYLDFISCIYLYMFIEPSLHCSFFGRTRLSS